jgi:hypothetical protein
MRWTGIEGYQLRAVSLHIVLPFTVTFIDSDEVPDFEVDIPLPKPPSFCSSTKVSYFIFISI